MKKFSLVTVLILLSLLLLTGCGKGTPTPTETPKPADGTAVSKVIDTESGISIEVNYLYNAETNEMLQVTSAAVEQDTVPETLKNATCAVAAVEENYAVLALTYKNADGTYQAETVYVYTEKHSAAVSHTSNPLVWDFLRNFPASMIDEFSGNRYTVSCENILSNCVIRKQNGVFQYARYDSFETGRNRPERSE